MWLYATLAHLEKPLPADVEVSLRQLYRVCGKLRAEAGRALEQQRKEQLSDAAGDDAKESAGGDGSSAHEPAAARQAMECAMHCNLLMTIVDRVFGQRVDVEPWPTV